MKQFNDLRPQDVIVTLIPVHAEAIILRLPNLVWFIGGRELAEPRKFV